VVYGRRERRPEIFLLQWARNLFYRITRRIADSDFVLYMAEFALVSRHVRDVMVRNGSTFPFLRAEIGYAGFRRLGIPYAREKRIGGKTHYNLFRMTQFAVGGILSSSTFPLRLSVYLGLPLLLANLIVGSIALWRSAPNLTQLLEMLNGMYGIGVLMSLSVYMARAYKDADSELDCPRRRTFVPSRW
jgi:dolichol-phosphate mannosyltransferase